MSPDHGTVGPEHVAAVEARLADPEGYYLQVIDFSEIVDRTHNPGLRIAPKGGLCLLHSDILFRPQIWYPHGQSKHCSLGLTRAKLGLRQGPEETALYENLLAHVVRHSQPDVLADLSAMSNFEFGTYKEAIEDVNPTDPLAMFVCAADESARPGQVQIAAVRLYVSDRFCPELALREYAHMLEAAQPGAAPTFSLS